MNILVTGSTGFIGKNFVDYLLKKNHNLCLVSKNKKLNFIKKNTNVIKLQCDINFNKKNLKKIINFKPNILVHLAWSGIPNYSKENSKKNLLRQKKFFKKIFSIPSIKKIIITGSCTEYKNKEYLTSKYFVDSKIKIKNFVKQECLKNRIGFVWARLFYVYGRYQHKRSLIPKIINSLKKNKKFEILNPLIKNDYINVADVVNFIKMNLNLRYVNYECDLGSSLAFKNIDIYNFIKREMMNLKNVKLKKYKQKKYFISSRKNLFISGWKSTINIEDGLRRLLN
jgi:dTDP-6-deoxy-L-talose 4-dehydrogenase (NAD+)